jgi:tripartite-type tricarboxylate transporter receptor subunit TctC
MRTLVALTLVLASAGVSVHCQRGPEVATATGLPGVVTLVTHSSPGGGSDVFLRELVPHLSRVMGVRFVVENLQGGSGARAMAAVARARPDGSVFYAATPTFIYTSLMSNPQAAYTDLEPVVNLFYDAEVLYTSADSRFRTLDDVLAHAREGSGKWGAANAASLERQTLERLRRQANVRPAIVSFDGGGDMLLNVLNHTLDMGIGELQEIRAQLAAGQLRLLGVAGDERLPQFPDVMTLKEQGIELAVRKFRGIAGPQGTPPQVIAAWEQTIPRLLDDADYRRVYGENGLQPGFIRHAEYLTFIASFGRDAAGFFPLAGSD